MQSSDSGVAYVIHGMQHDYALWRKIRRLIGNRPVYLPVKPVSVAVFNPKLGGIGNGVGEICLS